MEKANKNTHLNHLEDNVFLNGVNGTRDSINFIQSLRDLLQGNNSREIQTSVKWDGAPAIWLGPHPETGRFLVAKKSLFNKKPLYYVSASQIKNTDDLITASKSMNNIGILKTNSLGYDGKGQVRICLLYTSPSPRDVEESRMPSSA